MKTMINMAAIAILFAVAPSSCFAVWDVLDVSKQEANTLGLQVHTRASGAGRVSVRLEFKTEGKFQEFRPDSRFKDRSGVELWIGEGDNPLVTAALREDRSKADHVVFSFSADREPLNHSYLRVMVPYSDGGVGGVIYVLRVKDFVEPK